MFWTFRSSSQYRWRAAVSRQVPVFHTQMVSTAHRRPWISSVFIFAGMDKKKWFYLINFSNFERPHSHQKGRYYSLHLTHHAHGAQLLTTTLHALTLSPARVSTHTHSITHAKGVIFSRWIFCLDGTLWHLLPALRMLLGWRKHPRICKSFIMALLHLKASSPKAQTQLTWVLIRPLYLPVAQLICPLRASISPCWLVGEWIRVPTCLSWCEDSMR